MQLNKILAGFGAVSLALFGAVQAFSIDVSGYAFEKSFFLSEEQSKTDELSVLLDLETLQNINKNISNIALVDSQNSTADFILALPKPGVIKSASVLDVSSTKKGEPANLADLKIATKHSFKETQDQKNPAWMLVDLGSPVILNQLQLYAPSSAKINGVQIFGGLEKENLKPISSKRPFNYFINVKPEPVRFVRVEFEGFRVEIEDIFFLRSRSGQLTFKPDGKQRFKLLFGGKNADKPVFQGISAYINTKLDSVALPKTEWNKLFVTDADKDGITNAEDNCPFLANPKQTDTDGDKTGDKCDNAPEKKNFNQADSDEDTVGDIIDNCKLFVNPKQIDTDGDGHGDACDWAPESDENIYTRDADTTKNKSENKWFTIGLILVFVLSAAGAYFFAKKPNNK